MAFTPPSPDDVMEGGFKPPSPDDIVKEPIISPRAIQARSLSPDNAFNPIDLASDVGAAADYVGNIPAVKSLTGLPRALFNFPAQITHAYSPLQEGESVLSKLPKPVEDTLLFNPQMELGKKIPGTVGNIFKGISEGSQNIEKGLTTPDNLALMAAIPEGAAGKIISAVFAGQSAYSGVKQFPEFVAAVKSGDAQSAAKIGTEILGDAAITKLAGEHALSKEIPEIGEPKPKEVKNAIETQPQSESVPVQSKGTDKDGTPTETSVGNRVPSETPIQIAPEVPPKVANEAQPAAPPAETSPPQEGQPTAAVAVNSDAAQTETAPLVDQTAKYKIGKSPQTHSVVEVLPQTELEKEIGEQPVRVKNEKTGDEQVVMQSDLTPVKDRTGEAKTPKRDLDAELKAAKLDPSSFPNDASKRDALKRAAALADPTFKQKAETLAGKLENLKVKPSGKIQRNVGKRSGAINFGIAEDIWNKGVEVAQSIIRGGGSVADAIDAFVSHVKSKIGSQFDESGARRHLSNELGGSENTGIAARVSDERQQLGAINQAPESGESIGPKNYVERGRELITRGVDPEYVLQKFKETGKLDADDIAVVRAHEETLARAANDAESSFGTNSEEYKSAKKADNDWLDNVKKMQTEFARIGHAMQGETEIDTGTFHGLQREFHEQTGKDFTPKQEKEAKKQSGKVAKQQESTDRSKQELKDHLDNQSGGTDAEKRAALAVARVHRENAIKLAKAEKKAAEAKGASEKKAAEKERAAANKALQESVKRSRDAIAKLNKAREEAASKKASTAARDAEARASQDALDAVNKVHRDASTRLAAAEEKARNAKAKAEKEAAEAERKTAQKAVNDANKRRRDAAVKAAELERKHAADPSIKVWQKVREYLDKGVDSFDDIRNKIATDLGMPVKQVTDLLTRDKRAKFLANEVWKKKAELRRFKAQAKLWLLNQSIPGIIKIPRAVIQEAFNLKVLGHLSVGLGTHAPALFFQPQHWGRFFTNYGRMWQLGVSPALHEAAMQDLVRRENWTTARRAGLENDPRQHEEYDLKGFVERAFPRLSRGGNRAYDVLHILRQDLFDEQWNKLPQTMKTKAMAEGLSDDINHTTGIVQKSPFGKAGGALFAPRLLASRFAFAYGDPARAVSTGARLLTDIVKGERTVTPEEKAFAIQQVRSKATIVATMGAMLVANQALLSISGSKQKVNFDDPTKSDWLKFKAAGLDISFGNAMLTTLRLPVREAAILLNNTTFATGKKRFEGADRGTYEAVGEYFRNQLNPALGDVADVAFQSDAQGRPLPWSKQKVPKYLQAQGVTKPYTWGEWARDAALPIALEESVKQVFNDYGMPKDQVYKWAKIIGTAIYMGGTGGRISEDVKAK